MVSLISENTFNFRNGIPTALDMKDDKLLIFVPKEEATLLEESLDREIDAIGDVFKEEYRMHYTESPVTVLEEDDTQQYSPGCRVAYYDEQKILHFSTCGAFLTDEEQKLYIISSSHGNLPEKFYLQAHKAKSGKQERLHKLKRVATVFQKDPLLDAVLLEVNAKVEKKCTPHVRRPNETSAFCGTYTDLIIDLGVRDKDGGKKRPTVLKYGAATGLTMGELAMYDMQIPGESISNALTVMPDSSGGPFSSRGDCGSVVYKGSVHDHDGGEPGFKRHLGLAMICYGVTGLDKHSKLTLAFRLNDVIEHFEEELKKKLTLLPFNH